VTANATPNVIPNPGDGSPNLLLFSTFPQVQWRPGVAYRAGDKVVFNGLAYVARQGHTSQLGWEPPQTYALWARTDTGGVWAPQVLYAYGDVVLYQQHHYSARTPHQSQPGWEPSRTPALWQRLD
jgi:hypothetical protein